MRDRVDENGQYSPLKGATVISTPQDSDAEFWREIHTQLIKKSPTIGRYYAPLPYSSYHMTCCALNTEEELSPNEDWNTFMDNKTTIYSQLHNALSTLPILSNVKFISLSERNLIVLYVSLPQKRNDAIKEFAQQYDCEAGIPMCFHITLAYQYKEFTEEDHLKILEEVELLRNIFEQKKTLTFSPPKLCYFNDMSRFTPWDGKTNPFITPPLSLSSLPTRLYNFYNHVKENLPSLPICQGPRLR